MPLGEGAKKVNDVINISKGLLAQRANHTNGIICQLNSFWQVELKGFTQLDGHQKTVHFTMLAGEDVDLAWNFEPKSVLSV